MCTVVLLCCSPSASGCKTSCGRRLFELPSCWPLNAAQILSLRRLSFNRRCKYSHRVQKRRGEKKNQTNKRVAFLSRTTCVFSCVKSYKVSTVDSTFPAGKLFFFPLKPYKSCAHMYLGYLGRSYHDVQKGSSLKQPETRIVTCSLQLQSVRIAK